MTRFRRNPFKARDLDYPRAIPLGFLFFLGIPLALGSFWGLVPAFLLIPPVVLRTIMEDRTLQAELPGYKEYARRARYRLVPGIW